MNIVLPSLGDIDEVEVTEICVAIGDVVGADDSVIVIESDKASMEVPAGGDGTIAELLVQLGDRLGEGAVIGVLTQADGSAQKSVEETAEESQAASEPSSAATEVSVAAVSTDAGSEKNQGHQTVEIQVPDLGDIEQVEVIEVAVTAGAAVSPGDLLVVLESDKASMEIPAEISGTLLEVCVSEGDQVSAGSLLATAQIETADEAVPPPVQATDPAPQAAAGVPAQAAPPLSRPKAAAPTQQTIAEAKSSGNVVVYAGPATRRLAREIGVPLAQVMGTGNRGRVTKDDVKAWAKARLNEPASVAGPGSAGLPALPTVDFGKFGEIEEVPLSRIQKQVAVNMHRSWVNIPHVTQHAEANIADLEVFRQTMKAEAQARGVKLSPLPFIIKAVCHTLQAHPKLNGSVSANGEHLVLKSYINVGIAVDTPDGLVVPVIRGADQLGIWALAEKAQELAEKARSKKLALDDLSGGSFTISSLGALGGTGFTPIINAPEVAILGVGKSVVKPIWQNDGFAPSLHLPLSLSYDHRVINGTDGGQFMVTLTELLGDIRRLAL